LHETADLAVPVAMGTESSSAGCGCTGALADTQTGRRKARRQTTVSGPILSTQCPPVAVSMLRVYRKVALEPHPFPDRHPVRSKVDGSKARSRRSPGSQPEQRNWDGPGLADKPQGALGHLSPLPSSPPSLPPAGHRARPSPVPGSPDGDLCPPPLAPVAGGGPWIEKRMGGRRRFRPPYEPDEGRPRCKLPPRS